MKSGWWSVKWTCTLEGKEVKFWELSETTQEHILECCKNGDYCCGEICEPDDDDDSEDEND